MYIYLLGTNGMFIFQSYSPPGLVLSLSPGLGSISDGVPSPGYYRYSPPLSLNLYFSVLLIPPGTTATVPIFHP